jgi:transposase
MEVMKSHDRVLLRLNELRDVAGVALDVSATSVMMSLEYRGRGGVCPECGAECGWKDRAPERTWRHLDTMQFETRLKARMPRVNCGVCGVKTITVPCGERHSRFTLMFEAIAVDVLQCVGRVTGAAALTALRFALRRPGLCSTGFKSRSISMRASTRCAAMSTAMSTAN